MPQVNGVFATFQVLAMCFPHLSWEICGFFLVPGLLQYTGFCHTGLHVNELNKTLDLFESPWIDAVSISYLNSNHLRLGYEI